MATKWKIPVRKHLLSRGAIAQKANDFLSRAWRRGWLPPPPLSPDALWDSVAKGFSDATLCEKGGRTPEEVQDFRERLGALCASINAEAQLNSLGEAMAYGQLTRVIKNRLALGLLWHARPSLLHTKLAPPIIVVGHMRSGTTRIHKLLASDPAHSHTRYQDAFHPVPAKPGVNRVKSAIDLAMLSALNPWLQSIHPMGPKEVEEELAWISAALHHSIYESQWHIPSYSAFSEARDPTPIYSEFARILCTDAATRGIAYLPRVMKVPAFSEDLPALLAQFPDARIVIATRDREAVLRSAVSLCANQMAVQSDACDLSQIEALWEHKINLREQRMNNALKDWNGPVAQLQFEDLNNDWERAMKRCYGELGLSFSNDALETMRKAMSDSSTSAHHAHSAQLQRFASGA